MNVEVVHPSAEQLEAAAFGWLSEAEAEPIRAHARGCKTCAPRLALEEETRRQLTLLHRLAPRVSAVDAVLSRLERETRSGGLLRRPAPRLAVLGVVVTGALVSGWFVAGRRNRSRVPRARASLPRLIVRPGRR
jgi:hypothetical protein